MIRKLSLALVTMAAAAVPAAAQIVIGVPRDPVLIRTSAEADRANKKIPPGQLPPRGMCRVWIDGVPPGQQPAVTDCATAERNRVANSRVIYGDRESFPGKGKGKFKTSSDGEVARRCSVWDAVVVGGRLTNVCRDDRTVRRDSNGRIIRRDDDDDDDDDRDEVKGNAAAKAHGKAAKASAKANAKAGKEHGKSGKSHGKGKGSD
jgi:hypothetical protein